MNVAAYIRVSTSEQAAENQIPAIQDYCKAHRWPDPEIYAENDSAWKQGHQCELARLLDDIRSGRRKYDYLLVWALDRLSRQGIAAILQLVSTFETYGCHIVSIQEAWTTVDGPMQELFIAMAAWTAKFESDRRSERTKAGLARARANGKHLGRPVGSCDKGKRRKAGYLNRWVVNKRPVAAER